MKIGIARSWVAIVPLLTVISLPAPARAEDVQALGKVVVQELSSRRYDAAEARFDDAMRNALPAAKLAQLWDQLLAQAGAFQAITGTRQEESQGYRVVFVTCRFAKASLDLRVAFDSQGRVGGFFAVPTDASVGWVAPSYASPSTFHERRITVGTGQWQLPGTLSIPNGGGRYAAVVLVHGSGPQDADETIGPNKPFKDLAWGLASRKIAVLRYNKRTLEHAASFKDAMSGLTVKEETIDDARAAVALLAQQPEIDPKRIFVIGHSLGGMLAPRIAQGDPQVAGIILMAGTLNRSLGQVIVEQLKYLASLEGANPAEAQAQISAAEKAAKEIDSPELKPDATVNVLGSAIPGSYWLDLRGYDSVRLAAQLKIPILVLQGDRDFQVTVPDYEAWKKPFAGDPRVTFKLYPGLHHLFMPSEAKGSALATPADYEKPGHVVEAVVSDIASWVSSQVPM